MERISGEVFDPYYQEVAQQILNNIKRRPLKEARAQDILEYWITQAPQISEKQAEAIGILWMTKILGASSEAAQNFAHGNTLSEEIGMRHAGKTDHTPDGKVFWEGVREAVPEMVRENDLSYLTEVDGDGHAAWRMICTIDQIIWRNNFLTTQLVSNSLLYK